MAKHIARNITRLLATRSYVHSITVYKNIQKSDPTPFILQRTFVNFLHVLSDEQDAQISGILDYDSFLQENRIGPTTTKNALIELLHVPSNKVLAAIKAYPLLKELPRTQLLENYQVLCNKGVHKSTIRENIELLAYNSQDMQAKLFFIDKIDIDINDAILFLQLPLNNLKKFVGNCKDTDNKPSDRIKYLANELEISNSTICKLFIKNRQLRSQSKPVLQQKLQLFLSYGIPKADILNDVWVFNYNIKTIKEKLMFLTNNNINVRKTWIIRCSMTKLHQLFKIDNEKKKLLGEHSNVSDFIANKLNCDKLSIDYMLYKNPNVASANLKKINEILDLLQEHGYSADEIILASNLFQRSPEVLKSRMDQMKKIGSLPSRLSYLCISNKKFNSYLSSKEGICK